MRVPGFFGTPCITVHTIGTHARQNEIYLLSMYGRLHEKLVLLWLLYSQRRSKPLKYI